MLQRSHALIATDCRGPLGLAMTQGAIAAALWASQ